MFGIDSGTISIVLSVLTGAAAIIWQASRIKANVDTHGNAIGELKRRLDANDQAITEHHGRISKLEGGFIDLKRSGNVQD